MHILKIIHGYPPSYNAGSEVYSQNIVNELKKNHRVTVFTREENPFRPDFELRQKSENGVHFIFANMPRDKDAYNHTILNKRFAEALNELQPDIAHVGHLNHLSIGLVDELYRVGIPIIFTLHDFWLMCPRGQFLQRNFDGKNTNRLCSGQENSKCAVNCYGMYFSNTKSKDYYSFWIEQRMKSIRKILPKIDLFIAPSVYLMNRFINDFEIPAAKIRYLDYGFPLHYLRPVKPKQSKIFTFGYIGTHIPAKGIDLLIDAFSKLKQPAKLKIFGRSNGQITEVLKQKAKACPQPVEFCGEYINEYLVEAVFTKTDAIVVPSIWAENSPLVIHEAQACSIPVITADYGGMAEYVEHKVNGLLFKHRHTASLAKQMEYALNNPKQMSELGRRGYLYSPEGKVPNITKHVQTLESLYKQFINKYISTTHRNS
jgi:glycosyltransferase involved in cell wall biosynthesis